MRITRPCFAVLLLSIAGTVSAQDRRDEQFYYPGRFNWTFLKNYPEAARLFNAFDYGHAVLYERLLTHDSVSATRALDREFRFLTTDLLVRPPRFAVAEEVIEPTYAKLAWRAKQMFDWAHVLHRQIYDLHSDERLTEDEGHDLVERVTDYYLTRKDYAFTTVPKTMALMDDQPFSQTFRRRHPEFNGLIWAYHWLQVGLYEPLIAGRSMAERKAGVKETIARFWSIVERPGGFPTVMPMTATVAPEFSARHPRAAVIFDNLHMMHDIIADILSTGSIPRSQKRDAIYQQLTEFRDATRNVTSLDEWREMGDMMGGISRMGGPTGAATGIGTGRMADDSSDVTATVQRFHAALAAGDSAGALALLAPDVVILESGGTETLEEYRAHHLPGDIAFARAVTSQRGPVRVLVRGDVAWANATSTTTGEFRGRQINSQGVELMVLRRAPAGAGGGWRIVAIHWSSRARR